MRTQEREAHEEELERLKQENKQNTEVHKVYSGGELDNITVYMYMCVAQYPYCMYMYMFLYMCVNMHSAGGPILCIVHVHEERLGNVFGQL